MEAKSTVGQAMENVLKMVCHSYQQEQERARELRMLAMGILGSSILLTVALCVVVISTLTVFGGLLRLSLMICDVVVFGFLAVDEILALVAMLQIGHDILATPQELRARGATAAIDDSPESARLLTMDLCASVQVPFDNLCHRNVVIANLVRLSLSFMIASIGSAFGVAMTFTVLYLVFCWV